MVSITIGLLIMAGVVQLYLNSIQSQRSQEGTSRIQENMRYLTSKFTLETGMSGYMGCVPRYEGADERVINLLAKDSGASSTGVPEPYNMAGGSVLGTNDDGVNNSDTVSFRFVTQKSIPLQQSTLLMNQGRALMNLDGGNRTLFDSIEKGQIAVMTNCTYAHVFMVTGRNRSNGAVRFAENSTVSTGPNKGQKNLFQDSSVTYYGQDSQRADGSVMSRMYFAGMGVYDYKIDLSARGKESGGQCDADHPHYCALFRNDEELLEGVVDFQVEFGWKGATGINFGDAKAVGLASGWDKIDRVKLDVTLSAIEATGTNDGDASRRVKHEFTQVVKLRNPIIKG